MTPRLEKLAKALEAANKDAFEASHRTHDSGTCNLDSVVIKVRLTAYDLVQLNKACPQVRISTHPLMGGMYKGYRFINFDGVHGQANQRTMSTEAAHKVLKAENYDVHMYYHMD